MFELIQLNLILLSIIGFLNILVGLAILMQGEHRSASSRYFALLASAVGLWVLVAPVRYMLYTNYGVDFDPYHIQTKLSAFFAFSIFFCFTLFAFSFPGKQVLLRFWERSILFIIYGIVTVLIFTPSLLLQGEVFDPNAIQPIYDWGSIYYYVYIPALIFFFLFGLLRLTQRILKSNRGSILRGQLEIVLLGTGLGGVFGIVFGLLVASIPSLVDLFWVGRLMTLIFTGLTAYAILKTKLFDIKVVATELLTFALWIFLLIRALFSISPTERIINFVLFGLVIVAGFFLIRSVIREVEAREQIEQLATNLKAANDKLKELDKMKNQFLSFASHDLRAPLTAIRNFVSILLEGTYGKLPVAAENGVRQVFDRATEMAEMVDGYLNVSRIEQGRMKYDFTSIDFTQLLNETVSSFTNLAEEKGLKIVYTPVTKPIQMKADKGKMREVIQNLISNAIHYTPQGTITIRPTINANTVQVIFEDTGIGMSKEAIGKLFQLFAPGEDSKKYNTSSTGVGLYITKAHVEAHKGSIKAESDGKGKGSRFIIQLPVI